MKLPRWLTAAVSLLLLAALYSAADWRKVGRTLADLSPAYLAAALAMFVPQTLLSALRWQRLAGRVCPISLRESLRQTLAASALNLIVPSKLGDLCKAGMLPGAGASVQCVKAVSLAAVEKAADLAALCALWLCGWLGMPGWPLIGAAGLLAAVGGGGLFRLRKSHGERDSFRGGCVVGALTLALWALHLTQIDWFLKSAGVFVPWPVAVARLPAALFAGLLPVSFMGLGTRDSALIWLFADVAPPATMAAVGLLTALRYVVPGAAGIACLPGFASWRKLRVTPFGERGEIAA